ncbi:nuclear transport factor 2 family protein [Actinomadura atramentaria]|uniref:nuclear transport factor 2 family protein n=1 Tax=Actinomadura atramentaria TaxID=1990 RepID=UPI000381897A|nr:nuclear transport factor 2 family protein [Actinomadura atramentaria]
MTTFTDAVLAGDIDAIEAMLADDVVFTSPVAFRPYQGRAMTAAILAGVVRVFEDFRYVREIHDGPHHAYEFEATVNGLEINGCDFLTCDDDGKILDFKVMVRPLRAAEALAERMGAQFEDIKADAVARSKAGA